MTATSAKAKANQALQIRMLKRAYRHGNFRQTLIDCAFQCVRCADTSELEFHAPDGDDDHEDWSGKGRAPADVKRVLLCGQCHSSWGHFDAGLQARFIGMHLLDKSKLIEDVLEEMHKWGGYDEWLRNFKLDGSRLGVALPDMNTDGASSHETGIETTLVLIGSTLGILDLVDQAAASALGIAERAEDTPGCAG